MNALPNSGAIDLRRADSLMPEIVTYPVAVVDVIEGTLNASDTTHFLRITLPAQGKEIRVPYNQRSLRDLSRKVAKAGGIAQATQDQSEG